METFFKNMPTLGTVGKTNTVNQYGELEFVA